MVQKVAADFTLPYVIPDSVYSALLQPYTDDQLAAAIKIILEEKTSQAQNVAAEIVDSDNEDKETIFRRDEYKALQTPRNEELLSISAADLSQYNPKLASYFARIMLVHRLRETRAFAGFTRVFPENAQSLDYRKKMLRNHPLQSDDWLPAYVVYGEGIFLELDLNALHEWERQPEVVSRIQMLVKRYEKAPKNRKLRNREVTPRFVLLHTFAHLIMNRLTFECGYSSAALRERLYVSTKPGAEMAGVLIYTADGDSEGTMGGLVRMGKPGYLEPVIQRALEGAQWCSVDPVCMEMGTQNGQGPDSCNLAACHNCALVPETACEEFNRFLDRAVVIGQMDNTALGYFR